MCLCLEFMGRRIIYLVSLNIFQHLKLMEVPVEIKFTKSSASTT